MPWLRSRSWAPSAIVGEPPRLVGGGDARRRARRPRRAARRAPRRRRGRAAGPPRPRRGRGSAGRARRRPGGRRAGGGRSRGSSITQARSVAGAPRRSSSARVGSPASRGAAARPSSSRADPRAHLGGGALGEGEGEDRVDLDPVLGDRVAVAVDEHRASCRSRRPPRGRRRGRGRRSPPPARRSSERGRSSVGLELAASSSRRGHRRPSSESPSPTAPIARSSRQIGWKVQYFGHLPPSGRRSIEPAAHLGRGAGSRCARPRRGPASNSSRVAPVGADDVEAVEPRRRRRAAMPRGAAGRFAGAERLVEAADRVEAEHALGDQHVELDLSLPSSANSRAPATLACRSCSRGPRRRRPSGRRRCGRSCRAARTRRARAPRRRRRASLARTAEAELEQLRAGRSVGLARRPRASRKRLDLIRSAVERRAAGAVERRVARCVAALRRAARRSARRQRADVAGPRDRVAAGRLAVEALERARGRCRRARAGRPRARAAAGELVVDEPAVRALDPALERAGAEHRARAELAEHRRRRAAAPGSRSGSGSAAKRREHAARDGARDADPPQRRAPVDVPAAERQRARQLALARRLGGRRDRPARARGCEPGPRRPRRRPGRAGRGPRRRTASGPARRPSSSQLRQLR